MISELVSYLARGVVKQSEAVQVSEKANGGRIDVAVEVAAEDFGRIIGRNGQTINAIRLLANLVGEVLFNENAYADSMYICIEGRIITSRNNVDAGRFEAGNSFGISALLLDSKRLLTCTAQTETRVLKIHKQEFEEMLMEYPQISLEIAKLSTRRIQRLLEQIKKGETQESLLKNFFDRDPTV